MTAQIDIAEAKAKLSSPLDRALAGADIVIARAGKPLARLRERANDDYNSCKPSLRERLLRL